MNSVDGRAHVEGKVKTLAAGGKAALLYPTSPSPSQPAPPGVHKGLMIVISRSPAISDATAGTCLSHAVNPLHFISTPR
jgi:hypothetical protein